MKGRRLAMALGLVATGCGAPTRGEVLLFVDTDLDVPGNIDTLLVEVASGEGAPIDRREVIAATPDRWPLSFSLAAEDTTSAPVFRVRLSAYPAWAAIDPLADDLDAAAATPAACPLGIEPEGVAPLIAEDAVPPPGSPLPQYTASRLVEIEVPAGEIVARRVVVRATCVSAEPAAIGDGATCIDGSPGSPRDAIDEADVEGASPSEVGTSPLVAVKGCAEASIDGIDGRRCVPGGFGYLGNPRLTDVDASCITCNAVPPVPVAVRPFLMDTYEFTVGRLSDALHDPDPAKRFVPSSPDLLPAANGAGLDRCTWPADAGTTPVTDEGLRKLPLVCLDLRLADQLCAWAKGSLPSEAQWLFAATGRGKSTLYPWGNDLPSCRDPAAEGWPSCGQDLSFPFTVDAHPRDASIDGITGLAEGVTEILADVPGAASRPGCRRSSKRGLGFLAYTGGVQGDAPCACAGAFQTPEIESGAARLAARLVAGGTWGLGAVVSFRAAFHPGTTPTPFVGFRCVYPATPVDP